MPDYNAKNERIKEEYYRYQEEVEGLSGSTVDGICKALLRFEEYTRFKDFTTFNNHQAEGFKKHLLKLKTERTGEPLRKATVLSTLRQLQTFFKWLALQDGYKSKIDPLDIGYFNMKAKDVRIAQSSKLRSYPSLEQIRIAVNAMPAETDIERRDRALMAFAIISGSRDSAIISLKLKHVDIHNLRVTQYPDEVKTKRSKTIITGFYPVGEDFTAIVIEWAEHLRKEKLFSPDDPLFPKTAMRIDPDRGFQADGLSREHWNTTRPVCIIFQQAFKAMELPYFNPHSFRHTLAHNADNYCTSREDYKAWSQNLGHENESTTWGNYYNMSPHRQCEVIKHLGKKESQEDKLDAILKAVQMR